MTMTKPALGAITQMLNCFPQDGRNLDLILQSYKMALEGVPSEAIIEAAGMFIKGTVPGQNMTFAPSVAEFRDMATTINANAIKAAEKRRLVLEPPYEPPIKEDAATKARMGFKMTLLSKALANGKAHILNKATKSGRMDEMIALAQSWGVDVPEEIWSQKNYTWKPGRTKFDDMWDAKEAEYAGRAILADDVTLDGFRHRCSTKEFPVGAQWVPTLNGRVYGPKKGKKP